MEEDQKYIQRLFKELKGEGLSTRREEMIRRELDGSQHHSSTTSQKNFIANGNSDLAIFSGDSPPFSALYTIEELLERDDQRERDGFPRKIKLGRITREDKSGKNRAVVVPSTRQDQLMHDYRGGDFSQGGAGGEEEGDVIGEQKSEGEAGQKGQGGNGGDNHEIGENAYDLGKILSEKFELPNLQDKGKKKAFRRYRYELTDRNKGSGQLLDKKATLKKIVATNIALGRIKDFSNIDPSTFVINPRDKIYRVLSREEEFESQALVFFLRDYSGSMHGKPTEVVVTQHYFVHAWLTYQYDKLVEKRFVLHDTEAKEVPDFRTYIDLTVAGRTKVESGFKFINDIIREGNLDKDYNIYVCYGTDGDDWTQKGEETLKEIDELLNYVNRLAITVVPNRWSGKGETTVEKYINNSGILEDYSPLVRMDVLGDNASEQEILDSIKYLFSERSER